MNTPDFTNLSAWLAWLAAPLGFTWWMTFWSNLLLHVRNTEEAELSPFPGKVLKRIVARLGEATDTIWWFHKLVAFGVPALAITALEMLPPEVLAQLQPYWEYLTMLYAASLVAEIYFLFTKTKPATPTQSQTMAIEIQPSGDEPGFDQKMVDLVSSQTVTDVNTGSLHDFGEREPLNVPQPLVKPMGEPMGRVFSFPTAHQREIQRNRDEILARNLAKSSGWQVRIIA